MGKKIIWTPKQDFMCGNLKIKARRRYQATLITQRGDMVALAYRGLLFKTRADEIETVVAPEKKSYTITTTDYKNFADQCFEIAIRYRDRWRSVISGKFFEEGDWNGLHAGHGLSRGFWEMRHNAMNCHAITRLENNKMSLGDIGTINRYWDYVGRTFGRDAAQDLRTYKPGLVKLSIPFLRDECKRCFDFLHMQTRGNQRSAAAILKWRCEKLPRKTAMGILAVLETME